MVRATGSASLFASLVIAAAIVAPACGGDTAADDAIDVADPVDAPPTPDATPLPPPPDAEPPPPPDAILSFACTLEEIQPILTCVQENCLDNLSAECVTLNCGLLVLGLSPDCRDCVLTGVATGDLQETAAACVDGPALPGGIGG